MGDFEVGERNLLHGGVLSFNGLDGLVHNLGGVLCSIQRLGLYDGGRNLDNDN